MSVAENLEIAGPSGQSGRAGNRPIVIFELFPILKERQNQRAGTMSGGQQQMLAISMALKRQPRRADARRAVDRPCSQSRRSGVSAIQSINRDFGISIMLVEQNATKALKIADHVVILKTGAKVYDGAPDVLKDQVALMTYFLRLNRSVVASAGVLIRIRIVGQVPAAFASSQTRRRRACIHLISWSYYQPASHEAT